MSDREGQPGIGEASLDADVARWSADSALAPLFASPHGAVIVLDSTLERVVGVFGEGNSLRAALTSADGRLRAALRLPEQVRQIVQSPADFPRLVRLRLDLRGIAKPTACLVSRAMTGNGNAVVLITPTEPLPPRRIAPDRIEPAQAAQPEPEPEAAVRAPAPQTGRFVWRSDADGVVAQVSGGPADAIAFLVGQPWQALRDTGVASGQSFFDALAANRTFRTLSVALRPAQAGGEIDVDLSGAPIARAGQPFAGFSGFGIVRRRPAIARDAVAVPGGQTADSSEPPADAVTLRGEKVATETVAKLEADKNSESSNEINSPSVPSEEVIRSGDEIEAQGEGTTSPTADGAPPSRPSDLSTHEHDAFREIARALGARFAGDENLPHSTAAARPEGGGAVMAFPVSSPPAAGSAIDAAIVSALDRLPAGVLVHRSAEILYVNSRFLDLTGYEHREALVAAGGFSHLLDRLPSPQDGIVADLPVTITTGAGQELPLLVERSKVDWEGGPAELLLVRAAAQADQTRAQIARGLLEGREPTRERLVQELLDQVEEGFATLDEAGRVLTLNVSAKSLLSSDPCGRVGSLLVELFETESRAAVADGLRRAREAGFGAADEAFLRGDESSKPIQLRIHRLTSVEPIRFCATLRVRAHASKDHPHRAAAGGATGPDLLDRVSDEIRAPIRRILDRSEILLSEQNGTLASKRGGDYLREIHQSAEQILGVTDDLRDLSRIDAGRADLSFKDVALNDIVSDCIARVQPDAMRGRIVVRTSLSQEHATVFADERSMRQATHNVIANAIRLTEAGGQVIISTAVERGGIAFRVRDTGLGMTQDEIERALTARGSRDGVEGSENSGLGLLLTKALVEANRGRFRITSGKDEGTLVEMLFPSRQALSA